MASLLSGTAVTRYFRGVPALKDVDFNVSEKEILALIGPNGAGKTTLFNVVNGILRPNQGRIILDGEEITGKLPHEICERGLARTLQIPKAFQGMSILDNAACAAAFGRGRINIREAKEKAGSILDFIGLQRKDALARNVTLQERKKLELSMALATDPRIILVDEYMSGLNPAEMQDAIKIFTKIRDDMGVTIFWVEHVMKAVLGLAERVMVLDHGTKIAEGDPNEIIRNRAVIEAYLGKGVL